MELGLGMPESTIIPQGSADRPAEYIDDSADYEDYEAAASLPSRNFSAPSVQVINKRTGNVSTGQSTATGSYSELGLFPIRCYGCGKAMRQELIESSLESGKSLKETVEELDYVKICCRGVIESQPKVVAMLKDIERREKIAESLRLGQLFLEVTSERPRDLPSGNLTILDEVPPDFPVEFQGSAFAKEGAAILEEDPFEHMDAATYLQTQVGNPEDF